MMSDPCFGVAGKCRQPLIFSQKCCDPVRLPGHQKGEQNNDNTNRKETRRGIERRYVSYV